MTDITTSGIATPLAPGRDPVRANARLRSRYRAEMRFRIYGMAAIAVTAVFLVVLITDIVLRGYPAFFEHTVSIDVPLKADALAGNDGKVTEQSIRGADYFPITRDALTTVLPGLSRSTERTLTRLLSSGAGDDIRRRLVADPTLVGRTLPMSLLLSDDADLYLKSRTQIQSSSTSGTATPSDTTGEVTITSSSNDFAGPISAAKAELARRAALLRREITRLKTGAGAAAVADRIAELEAQVAEFQKLADAGSNDLQLDGQMASTLVAINGGIVKISRITPTMATGDVIIPLSAATVAAGMSR